jgi:hypothetical protein
VAAVEGVVAEEEVLPVEELALLVEELALLAEELALLAEVGPEDQVALLMQVVEGEQEVAAVVAHPPLLRSLCQAALAAGRRLPTALGEVARQPFLREAHLEAAAKEVDLGVKCMAPRKSCYWLRNIHTQAKSDIF